MNLTWISTEFNMYKHCIKDVWLEGPNVTQVFSMPNLWPFWKKKFVCSVIELFSVFLFQLASELLVSRGVDLESMGGEFNMSHDKAFMKSLSISTLVLYACCITFIPYLHSKICTFCHYSSPPPFFHISLFFQAYLIINVTIFVLPRAEFVNHDCQCHKVLLKIYLISSADSLVCHLFFVIVFVKF